MRPNNRCYIIIYLLGSLLLGPFCTECKSSGNVTATNDNSITRYTAKKMSSALPKAKIYKVNPYYVDKVAVSMSPDKSRLISFPAPSDVTDATSPVGLIDGYYLDCQGIGINTMFLQWTRHEYNRMSQTPSKAQIMEAILPASYIEEIIELPLTTSLALSDTATVNNMIREGLPGCKVIKGAAINVLQPDRIIGTEY